MVAVNWLGHTLSQFGSSRVSPANRDVFGVEPRGFEPLTSAVQSQTLIIARVRGRSNMPAKPPIRLYDASQLFAAVGVGWCTYGVFGVARLACVLGQGRRVGSSCYRPTRKGWTMPSAGWS